MWYSEVQAAVSLLSPMSTTLYTFSCRSCSPRHLLIALAHTQAHQLMPCVTKKCRLSLSIHHALPPAFTISEATPHKLHIKLTQRSAAWSRQRGIVPNGQGGGFGAHRGGEACALAYAANGLVQEGRLTSVCRHCQRAYPGALRRHCRLQSSSRSCQHVRAAPCHLGLAGYSPSHPTHDTTTVASTLLQSGQVLAQLKHEGNNCFAKKEYAVAIGSYDKALQLVPADSAEAALLHSNKAACHMMLKK